MKKKKIVLQGHKGYMYKDLDKIPKWKQINKQLLEAIKQFNDKLIPVDFNFYPSQTYGEVQVVIGYKSEDLIKAKAVEEEELWKKRQETMERLKKEREDAQNNQ